MTEVPTTEWTQDFDERSDPNGTPRFSKGGKSLAWRRLPGVVRHTFTHFPLELTVYTAKVPANAPAPAGTRWIALADIGGEALPSLMRKVVAHAATDNTKATRARP